LGCLCIVCWPEFWNITSPMLCASRPRRYCLIRERRFGVTSQPSALCLPLYTYRLPRPQHHAVDGSANGNTKFAGYAETTQPKADIPSQIKSDSNSVDQQESKRATFTERKVKAEWSKGTVQGTLLSKNPKTRCRRMTAQHQTDIKAANEAAVRVATAATRDTPVYSTPALPLPRSVSEAVCQYIDFLTRENERQTKIERNLPVSPAKEVNLWHEQYYHEVMSQPISVPTSRFSDWLRNVHNLELELNERGRIMTHMTIAPSSYFPDTSIFGRFKNPVTGCRSTDQHPNVVSQPPHHQPDATVRKRRLRQHQQSEQVQTSGFHLLIDAADQTVVREELVDGTSYVNDSTTSGKTYMSYRPFL
jgi:hypothetical protein